MAGIVHIDTESRVIFGNITTGRSPYEMRELFCAIVDGKCHTSRGFVLKRDKIWLDVDIFLKVFAQAYVGVFVVGILLFSVTTATDAMVNVYHVEVTCAGYVSQ